jgi:MFS family permease
LFSQKGTMRPGWVLGVLLAGPFMAQADATIANVAAPSIHASLGASGAALELVIGGYLIAFAVLLITGARLGQTHGYRRVYLLGVGIFTVASLLCGLALDPVMLVLARVLQGAGAALMFPQTLTGIQVGFAGQRRTRAIGLYAVALSSGAVIGQILGGVLISANLAGSSWRPVFLVNVPAGVLAIAAGLRAMPADANRTRHPVDIAGVILLSVAMLLLVVPLTVGRSQGWPAWTWLCLAASVPAAAGFISQQRRVAARAGAPLIMVSVVAGPPVRATLIALTAATGTYYALLFTLALYLQQGLAESPLAAGLTLVPWVAAFGLAGQLVRRLPPAAARLTPAAGCLLLTAAYAAISTALFAGQHGQPLLLVLLGAGGLGLGVNFSSMITRLTDIVPVDYAPDISGVSTTLMQIGGAVSVAAFGTLYLSADSSSGNAGATHAFALTATGLTVLALVACIFAYRATRPTQRAESLAPASPVTSSGRTSQRMLDRA